MTIFGKSNSYRVTHVICIGDSRGIRPLPIVNIDLAQDLV